MDPGSGVCPAFVSNHRHSQPAAERLLAFALPALRTIHPGLGFLAVGLEQGGVPRDSVRNRAGRDPVCCHAVQPATLVAAVLVSRGANPVRRDLYYTAGDRSAVQQV